MNIDAKPISKATLKNFKRLKQKKYRETTNKLFIEGLHLVEEAINSDWKVEEILVTPNFIKKYYEHKIFKEAKTKNITLRNISESELNLITDTINSQGIGAIVSKKHYDIYQLMNLLPSTSCLVFLENISEPGNLGTIIRICDWFGVDAVILSNKTVELCSPKVVRSTMGSLFKIPIFEGIDTSEFIKIIKNSPFTIYATRLKGKNIKDFEFTNKSCFIFGNEAHGISKLFLNTGVTQITIPKYGKAESLNVAVACGITLAKYRIFNNHR